MNLQIQCELSVTTPPVVEPTPEPEPEPESEPTPEVTTAPLVEPEPEPESEPTPDNPCKAPVDLVFLVDGSDSLGSAAQDASKEFMKEVVDNFHLGTGTLDGR